MEPQAQTTDAHAQLRPTGFMPQGELTLSLLDIPKVVRGDGKLTDPAKLYHERRENGYDLASKDEADDLEPEPFATSPLCAELSQTILAEADAYEVTESRILFYRSRLEQELSVSAQIS